MTDEIREIGQFLEFFFNLRLCKYGHINVDSNPSKYIYSSEFSFNC